MVVPDEVPVLRVFPVHWGHGLRVWEARVERMNRNVWGSGPSRQLEREAAVEERAVWRAEGGAA